MYDAIVVGGRPAGSTTALLLARRGHRVLVVDRATFPSDTTSTHVLQVSGGALLHRWALFDALLASGAPPIETVSFDFGGLGLTGSPPPADGLRTTLCPRRTVLDTLLLEAAAAAGAEVRQGFTVTDLTASTEGRVTGIEGRDDRGIAVRERARVVIGADGRHSRVARTVAAEEYEKVPAVTCFAYSYWHGFEPFSTDGSVFLRDRRLVGTFPTNDDLTIITLQAPREDFHELRRDVKGGFLAALDGVEGLGERARAAERVERFRITADLDNAFRVPWGPGWALVGDAGCHKDPVTAQGISDALRDADALAAAVDAWLTGRDAWDDALGRYQRNRDLAELPRYHWTLEMAALDHPPTPEQEALIAALAHDQAAAERFLGLFAGTVAVDEFFSEQHLGELLGQAAPHSVEANPTPPLSPSRAEEVIARRG